MLPFLARNREEVVWKFNIDISITRVRKKMDMSWAKLALLRPNPPHSSTALTPHTSKNKCIGDDTKAAARQIPNCILKKQKIKYGEKRFSVWQMELLHPLCGMIMTVILPRGCTLRCGMWLWNHDSEFTKWQHPAIWYVALGWHAVEFAQRQHPTTWNIALGSWNWIRQVAAPCNVAGGYGMTCHGISPNVRRIGILHLVSILTTSPQSTRHSAPVCKILSKWDHPLQKKMTSCRLSRWRISAILDFRGPIMGSVKSPCTTSYRSSIEIIALNCLV